jgi:hypothetical protein
MVCVVPTGRRSSSPDPRRGQPVGGPAGGVRRDLERIAVGVGGCAAQPSDRPLGNDALVEHVEAAGSLDRSVLDRLGQHPNEVDDAAVLKAKRRAGLAEEDRAVRAPLALQLDELAGVAVRPDREQERRVAQRKELPVFPVAVAASCGRRSSGHGSTASVLGSTRSQNRRRPAGSSYGAITSTRVSRAPSVRGR